MTGLLRQNPTITAVLCYNNVVATGAVVPVCYGLEDRAGRWRRERYFEQRWRWRRCRRAPEATSATCPSHG